MCKTFSKIYQAIFILYKIFTVASEHIHEYYLDISPQILSFVKASHISKTWLYLNLIVDTVLTTVIPMGYSHIGEIPLKIIHFLFINLEIKDLTQNSFVSHLRPLKPVFDASSLTQLMDSSFRKHEAGYLNYLLTPWLSVWYKCNKSIRVLSYDKLTHWFGIVCPVLPNSLHHLSPPQTVIQVG